MHFLEFHTEDGMVKCGPFRTFEKAQDFALQVEPEAYSVVVFKSPETEPTPRRRRTTHTESATYKHMEKVGPNG